MKQYSGWQKHAEMRSRGMVEGFLGSNNDEKKHLDKKTDSDRIHA